jgi:hypothetical protein
MEITIEFSDWVLLSWPPVWRVLLQGVVHAVVVMIVQVSVDQAPAMLLIQWDDVDQDLSPATSHPSFGDPVLLHACRLQERDHIGVKLRVAVEEDVSVRGNSGQLWTTTLGGDIILEHLHLHASLLQHSHGFDIIRDLRKAGASGARRSDTPEQSVAQ